MTRRGALFDETLALCLLQAKNNTQPSLQAGGGGLHVFLYECVAPNLTAGD